MQISKDAADAYREHGIQWEEAFISGETQRLISKYLDPGIPRYDALDAFVDTSSEERFEASRAANGLGEFFVYNRGDKLDWNHPTRAGHQKIADLMIRRGVLEAPRVGAAN